MSSSCKQIAPVLYRVAEGEATPHEAMWTACHLSDCTACRILLAREVRLAAMLEEGLDDPLQVDEDFVRQVMDSVPQGPPPPGGRTRVKRRTLKLACLAGLVGLAPLLAAAPGPAQRPAGRSWGLAANLDVPFADGTTEGALRVGGLIVTALTRVAAALPVPGEPPWSGLLAGVALLAPFGFIAALAWASVLAVAVRGRPRPPSRSV
jgi:hypothetical protein